MAEIQPGVAKRSPSGWRQQWGASFRRPRTERDDARRASISAPTSKDCGRSPWWPSWYLGLGGGFVGVDVFFVISGFLITRLLMSEFTATGGVRLAAFYAARARRLLPAAGTVLVIAGIFVFTRSGRSRSR